MSTTESFMAAEPERGVALEICKVPAGLRFTAHSYVVTSVWVDPKDAPAIAVSVLKAAGRTDLAEYIGAVIEKEAEAARIAEAVSPRGLTRCHLCNDGIAQAKAAREAAEKAEAEAAEKKLQERRDALATKFLRMHTKYNDLGPAASLRPAIDYAIDLEDKLDGASRD